MSSHDAVMFPERVPSVEDVDRYRKGEVAVYHALKKLSASYEVFYNTFYNAQGGLRAHDPPPDFVILNQKCGFLLIEVKGGKIKYENGVFQHWYDDQWNAGKDPVQQVRRAGCRLIANLKSDKQIQSYIGEQICVIFPHTKREDAFQSQVTIPKGFFFKDDMNNLSKCIEDYFHIMGQKSRYIPRADYLEIRKRLIPYVTASPKAKAAKNSS